MVQSNKQFLTSAGRIQLEEELNNLKTTKRPDNIQKIKTAQEQGDLSENAEYSAAKDDQRQIESRIQELEMILRTAGEIKEDTKSDQVQLGSTIEVLLVSQGLTKKLTIVGSQEANPKEGKISNQSPLGKAFIGNKHGDEIAVEVPSGKLVYQITKIG